MAQLQQVIVEVESERDKVESDLNTIESAFADLYHRYEQLRLTVEGFKKNEATWKTEIEDHVQKLDKQEQKYRLLKKHVEGKLEEANQKVEKVSKVNQNEITWLKAALKRAEMKVDSLEQQLEQKAKENKELTSICDDLFRAQDSAK
ncbi:hypothetical protein LSH36_769g00062 [Paralvinella palmiformis]|uniref:Transforming acidic coiled-coil-containing protein C-terminal domain-containing protein n=1 Tax=Paralvinella palmiformis TaxID=53620 RepID=A0AAD9MU85_9ANNE|nr:hypothetical protein LSH36_769g00062 [Paralvinella palmiformis]